jgi:hypothetical protein
MAMLASLPLDVYKYIYSFVFEETLNELKTNTGYVRDHIDRRTHDWDDGKIIYDYEHRGTVKWVYRRITGNYWRLT